MLAFLAAFFIALAITLAGLPWVRRAALALNLVDAPSQRKAHRTPMPLLGGVGIFLGAILAVLVIYRGEPEPQLADRGRYVASNGLLHAAMLEVLREAAG